MKVLLIFALLVSACPFARAESGGSIHNHLTLDLIPIVRSKYNPVGGGFGLSFDHYHEWLKSSYFLTLDAAFPYQTGGTNRWDLIPSLGFVTQITQPFSLGARVGAVAIDPNGASAFGAIVLRLPALHPEEKEFFSFFFEEIDLGLSGSGSTYASFRFAMTLF